MKGWKMNNVLYAGGARPSTGGDNGVGNIDTSGLLKTDVSNLTVNGRSVIAGIAADSVSLGGLADVNLSNLSAAGREQIARLSKPSSNRTILTFPDVADSTFIMPGSGYLVAYIQNTATAGASTWITLSGKNGDSIVVRAMDKGVGTATLVAMLPVSKEMTVNLLHSGNFQASANKYFWFTSAEGAQ